MQITQEPVIGHLLEWHCEIIWEKYLSNVTCSAVRICKRAEGKSKKWENHHCTENAMYDTINLFKKQWRNRLLSRKLITETFEVALTS